MARSAKSGTAPASPNHSFREFTLEQLSGMEDLRSPRLFGGFGLYAGPWFFGIIYHGRLYFRTSETTREKNLAAGMTVFQPGPKAKLHAYYEVPAAVLENRRELRRWAQGAIGAAQAAAAAA